MKVVNPSSICVGGVGSGRVGAGRGGAGRGGAGRGELVVWYCIGLSLEGAGV